MNDMEYTGTLKSIKGNLVTFEVADSINVPAVSKDAKNGQILANIAFQNKNMITDDQRKKTFALINDVAEYTGYPPDVMYDKMKYYFMAATGCDVFSLSRNSVTKKFASRFIEFCIEWCFQMEIPFKYREYHLAADISRTLFIYLKYRMCFVCGRPHADIAHVETVGMGNNRRRIDHRKHHFMALCREHHEEQHRIGIKSFMDLYHLAPIQLNDETIVSLKIMTEQQLKEFNREERLNAGD